MDSLANREKARKEDIRRQIDLLKSQLSDDEETPSAPSSSKRKLVKPGLLVPSTPSPRKKRKLEEPQPASSRNVNILATAVSKVNSRAAEDADYIPVKLAPSKLVQNLSKLHSEEDDSLKSGATLRTSSFSDKPPEITKERALYRRDEDLAIIESLPLGPAEHKPPFDDPHFERVEPNSGIRLKSRILPHEDLQDHLRGRYYLSPSLLYSCIRLLPDKTGYDIPVDGDWITIAVVAERGPIKYTSPPAGVGREDDVEVGDPSTNGKNKGGGTKKTRTDAPNRRRRYVNVKLIDFGSRSSSSSSTKGQIRGDAFLTLLLFEAEMVDLITEEYGAKLAQPKKVYRGGSGGAFEAMAKLKEGDVIALLNPRIMKPFTNSSSSNPHPIHNILAVTPTNANSIIHIGRSLDLGMCTVQKRDGSTCGSWCDKRISNVCEWHVTNAVQRRRAARPELAVGTSGMTNSAAVTQNRRFDPKSEYDPVRKTGLLPRGGAPSGKFASGGSYEGETGATYVLSGHVINGSNSVDTTHVSEQMGREGQARAQRAEARRQEDELLKKMLKKEKAQDSTGRHMKSVLKAREVVEKLKEEEADDAAEDEDDETENVPTASRYRPEMIKNLGFDPVAMKLGSQRKKHADVQKKLDDLAALQKSRNGKEINLGPRPGPKIRSGVFKPTIEPARFRIVSEQCSGSTSDNASPIGTVERMVDLDSDDD
ncbi:hypothetical protein GYMLUDRAFT_180535 [Collybiopsis luxurians FD-317 M1]|uniref:Zinc finger Mcm10/DnaG-type domain-containing protein n=1 Tax=Collybiopsis luxurians FD-317 M1 TaxID=944289 RepID=A0A0D0BCC0_9AGAR|nr:hypothetical protein GYMLUDRAFT_180535 [Collybiopsis luxurians FD-317 M1]